MELQQGTFWCWNSSLVCSRHKFCARKGSLLPVELLGTSMEYPPKNKKKGCVHIPHSGSLNARCCIPHSSAPALTIPIVQHTRVEWWCFGIQLPWKSAVPGCQDCLVPSERSAHSWKREAFWITVIIPEQREFPFQSPPRINQFHTILSFAGALLPNCWESPALERWFPIFLYETDHIVLCAGHLKGSTCSKSCRFCVFMSSDPALGTQPSDQRLHVRCWGNTSQNLSYGNSQGFTGSTFV